MKTWKSRFERQRVEKNKTSNNNNTGQQLNVEGPRLCTIFCLSNPPRTFWMKYDASTCMFSTSCLLTNDNRSRRWLIYHNRHKTKESNGKKKVSLFSFLALIYDHYIWTLLSASGRSWYGGGETTSRFVRDQVRKKQTFLFHKMSSSKVERLVDQK